VYLFTLQLSGSLFTRKRFDSKIVEHGIADIHPPLADAPPARIALGDSSELAAFAAQSSSGGEEAYGAVAEWHILGDHCRQQTHSAFARC
jgi:hypothetical protein